MNCVLLYTATCRFACFISSCMDRSSSNIATIDVLILYVQYMFGVHCTFCPGHGRPMSSRFRFGLRSGIADDSALSSPCRSRIWKEIGKSEAIECDPRQTSLTAFRSSQQQHPIKASWQEGSSSLLQLLCVFRILRHAWRTSRCEEFLMLVANSLCMCMRLIKRITAHAERQNEDC